MLIKQSAGQKAGADVTITLYLRTLSKDVNSVCK